MNDVHEVIYEDNEKDEISPKKTKSVKRVRVTESMITKYTETSPFLKHIRVSGNTNGIAYVDDTSVVGIVNLETKENDEVWIQALEVQKDHRRSGLGSKLLKWAINQGKAEFLSVRKQNKVAIEMYKKSGFHTYQETKSQYYMTTKDSKEFKESSLDDLLYGDTVFYEDEQIIETEDGDGLIVEACKDVTTARKFLSEVGKLAKKYNANYFIVTDGASKTLNDGNPAVEHARNSHKEWERRNKFDPDEDWRNEILESGEDSFSRADKICQFMEGV